MVEIDYLNKMNQTCIHCGAFYFKTEETNNGYNLCCSYGKTYVEEDTDYSKFLLKTLTDESRKSTNFRTNIREYNNELAFGSFVATLDKLKTPGPPVYRIHGQTYRNIPQTIYNDDKTKCNKAQLYVLDNEEANEIRGRSNENLREDLLKELEPIYKRC